MIAYLGPYGSWIFFPHDKMSMNGIDADMASLFYVKVEAVIKAAQIGQGSLLANIK